VVVRWAPAVEPNLADGTSRNRACEKGPQMVEVLAWLWVVSAPLKSTCHCAKADGTAASQWWGKSRRADRTPGRIASSAPPRRWSMGWSYRVWS